MRCLPNARYMLASMSALLPVALITTLLLVNGHFLRSGKPAPLAGPPVLIAAILLGEVFISFAFRRVSLKILALLVYPVVAYASLIFYIMFFGAIVFPDIPW
jgi:hypothetical protein